MFNTSHQFGYLFASKCRLFGTSAARSITTYPFFNIHRPVTDPEQQDPEYFEKRAEKLPLDSEYIDALKSLWEEKIGAERELMLKASDNLIGNRSDYGLPVFPPLTPRLEYAQVDALKTAPESVRRIFSIDYGKRSDQIQAWKRELIERAGETKYDDNSSYKRKIAWATACIRHWTALVDELMSRPPKHTFPYPKPKWLLHRIKLMIDHRRKLLRLLRIEDEAGFNAITNDLNIAYYVEKPPEHVKTRKAWSEAQLRFRVNAEKEKRLAALHAKLQNGRDERMQKINAELTQLDEEKKTLEARLTEIDELEGISVRDTVGKYEPKYVEELMEIMSNALLFGFPPPKYDADTHARTIKIRKEPPEQHKRKIKKK